MATSAHHSTRDQNMNLLYNGSTPGRKTNCQKADKKGGHGGRKALNDISNSRNNPSIPQLVKKSNLPNVIPIDKGPSTPRTKLFRVPDKRKIGGRKPLTDVTNSVEPCLHQVHKAILKPNAVAHGSALNSSILDEGFLHDHQECIKGQRKTVDMDYFLTSVGLSNADTPMHLSAKSSPVKQPGIKIMSHLKIKEIQEPPLHELDHDICSSPDCKPPNSPPPLCVMNCEDDDNAAELVLELMHP